MRPVTALGFPRREGQKSGAYNQRRRSSWCIVLYRTWLLEHTCISRHPLAELVCRPPQDRCGMIRSHGACLSIYSLLRTASLCALSTRVLYILYPPG